MYTGPEISTYYLDQIKTSVEALKNEANQKDTEEIKTIAETFAQELFRQYLEPLIKTLLLANVPPLAILTQIDLQLHSAGINDRLVVHLGAHLSEKLPADQDIPFEETGKNLGL